METRMNLFYLDNSPKLAAQYHCDRHNVKMVIEHCQMLSTAHRILDGQPARIKTKTGRNKTEYVLPDQRESILYKTSHANHPTAAWVRQSKDNYAWMLECTKYLLEEYTYRYGRIHASSRLLPSLNTIPHHIADSGFTEPPPAMPDHCKVPGNVVESYRKYYVMEKKHFAKWTKRPVPDWFIIQ
jgi:hypothetical protein